MDFGDIIRALGHLGKSAGAVPVNGISNTMIAEMIHRALDATAARAVELVKDDLSIAYNGISSRPGEPPRMRTGSLRDSIDWISGGPSAGFPQPSSVDKESMRRFKQMQPSDYRWYKAIRSNAYNDRSLRSPYPAATKLKRFVRSIGVSPTATDRSDRERLQYYSYYLESGWYSAHNADHNDKGYVESPSGESNWDNYNPGTNTSEEPVYNPPRPYLSRLQTVYRGELERYYHAQLVAQGMPHNLAQRSHLKVVFTLGRRVPFLRDMRS